MIDAQQCLVFQVNSSLGYWWRRRLARDRTVFLTLLTKEEENTQKWRVCQYYIIRKDLLAVCSCSHSELEVVHTGEENLPGEPSSWRKQCSGFWLKCCILRVLNSQPGKEWRLMYLQAIPIYWSTSTLLRVCGCEQAQGSIEIFSWGRHNSRKSLRTVWCSTEQHLHRPGAAAIPFCEEISSSELKTFKGSSFSRKQSCGEASVFSFYLWIN